MIYLDAVYKLFSYTTNIGAAWESCLCLHLACKVLHFPLMTKEHYIDCFGVIIACAISYIQLHVPISPLHFHTMSWFFSYHFISILNYTLIYLVILWPLVRVSIIDTSCIHLSFLLQKCIHKFIILNLQLPESNSFAWPVCQVKCTYWFFL